MEVIFKVLWTETALLHLKIVYDYYSLKANRSIAQKLIQKIIKASIILENNPQAGKKEELLKDRKEEFRFIVSKNYKILYWIDFNQQSVFISMVFDTRQNPEKIRSL